jgi:hypothetical protein
MATDHSVKTLTEIARLMRWMAVGLGIALTPSYASAQARLVGGHIGAATSFATVGKTTDTISDRSAMVVPIGISVHTSDHVVVDFETQTALPIHPSGATTFNVDPGIIYNFGPAAVGLRILFPIGAPTATVGLIPLINKGIADLTFGTWFLEAAFPVQYHASGPGIGSKVTLDLVLHTGIAF